MEAQVQGELNSASQTSGLVGGAELAHRVERVGVLGALVGPIAQDAREAERHTARVARAALDAVEGDLDHQLGRT